MKVIWFNRQPFSKTLRTNETREFLNRIAKLLASDGLLRKIFNKNNRKGSYSCLGNKAKKIISHISKLLASGNDVAGNNRE